MRRRAVALALLMLALAAPTAAAEDPGGDAAAADWRLVSAGGVAIGGGRLDDAHARELREDGFGAVVSERGWWLDDGEAAAALAGVDLDHLSLPGDAPHARPFSLDDIVGIVEWMTLHVEEGEPVFAHVTPFAHRPVAMVTAYVMVESRLRVEDAFALVQVAAPEAQLLEAAALYELESKLFAEERLDVDLRVDQASIELGGAANVRAHVMNDGHPVEGARVELAPAAGGALANATTDDTGVATFRYHGSDAPSHDDLRALARKDGYVSGFDRLTIHVGDPRPPTIIKRIDLGVPQSVVEPGALMSFIVQAYSGADATRVRVTITDGCETLHRATTGEDARADVLLKAPRAPGAYDYRIRVHHVESPPIETDARVIVGDDGEPPPCDERLPGGPPVEVRLQAPPPQPAGIMTVALPSTLGALALLGAALIARSRRVSAP